MALIQGIELRVGPGELHRCTDAVARTVALGTGEVTRCVLGPGVFPDHLECKHPSSIAKHVCWPLSPSTPPIKIDMGLISDIQPSPSHPVRAPGRTPTPIAPNLEPIPPSPTILDFGPPANLEIVGSGPETVMQGDVAVAGLQWVPYHPQNATGNNATAIYRAILPPALRIKNIQRKVQQSEGGVWGVSVERRGL